MSETLINASKDFVKKYFEENVSEDFSYHNYQHTSAVVDAAQRLSSEAKLNEDETEILILSALFHDVGFGIDPDNHEYHSEKIARLFLESNGYSAEKIDLVSKCIMATKLDWKGEDKLCCLMKDADLSGLANNEYSKIAENLRQEKSTLQGINLDKQQWLIENISFIQNHDYFSEEGKKLYEKGKLKNLKKLKKLENKTKDKPPKLLTIGSSKSAQTQLKTALRNHIDLSSIADNKANIMLSVNAIVITVGIPLLVDRSYDNEQMIVPTAILALASLVSMVFATLSTRPAKMNGKTTSEMIKEKKSNLFFFGNYFKMSFEEYEEGMKTVVSDNEILDNSITRDLFFLGHSLGHKYQYLRWCYNIFMYGIGLAMVSFLVILLFDL